jgi:uncharacterized protein
VNVNAKDDEGYTPLHVAVVHARDNVVRVLCAHRANVNAKTNDGKTPLMLAEGSPNIVRILKEAGAK